MSETVFLHSNINTSAAYVFNFLKSSGKYMYHLL
jgi:hypothetical protein